MKTKLTRKITKNISALQARQKFGELLDRTKLRGERFKINRSGKPMAIIMSIADYEDMEDLIDTLLEEADPEFQKELEASHKEYEDRDIGTEEDLWDSLKQKRHVETV